MHFSSDLVKHKLTAEVELTLTDGSVLTGKFFIHAMQRILDIMNDERPYVPFADSEGAFIVMRKSIIGRVKPVDQTIERGEPLPTAIGRT